MLNLSAKSFKNPTYRYINLSFAHRGYSAQLMISVYEYYNLCVDVHFWKPGWSHDVSKRVFSKTYWADKWWNTEKKDLNLMEKPLTLVQYVKKYGPRYGYLRAYRAYVHVRSSIETKAGYRTWCSEVTPDPAILEYMLGVWSYEGYK